MKLFKRLCKKLWLKHYIMKYEHFLLKKGIDEAYRRNENIRMGLDTRLVSNDDKFKSIYLHQNKLGQTNISPILALGAENHPEEARKYVTYGKMLERLNR